MKYSKDQVLKGLQIVRKHTCEMDKWHKACFELMNAGFTVGGLKDQAIKYGTLDISVTEKSKIGDYGGALNMLYNYMGSFLGAQYVRDQFLNLLDNYLNAMQA